MWGCGGHYLVPLFSGSGIFQRLLALRAGRRSEVSGCSWAAAQFWRCLSDCSSRGSCLPLSACSFLCWICLTWPKHLHQGPPLSLQLDSDRLALSPLSSKSQCGTTEMKSDFCERDIWRDDASVRKKGDKKLKMEDERKEEKASAGLRDLVGSL